MSESFTAFFYGTLLHPAILRRVIGHEGQTLTICPVLLLEHTRHQIKGADYPAVVPYSQSHEFFKLDLSPEDRTVRGTLVSGLSTSDIELLDIFEGDEYIRTPVSVHPLGPFISLSASESDPSIAPLTTPVLPPLSSLPASIPAETYVWAQPLSRLAPAVWDYGDFVRTNAWKWVGQEASENMDYVEVDRRREMNGKTARTEVVGVPKGEGISADRNKAVVDIVESLPA